MRYPLNIVGESINASIPAIKKAIVDRDEETIKALARQQAECGAHMLDVNGGVTGRDEAADLIWLVKLVQSACGLPLVLDSSDPAALAGALKEYRGASAILSSITGEMTEGHKNVVELAMEHNCGLVVMCMDSNGIPPEPAKRVSIAEKIVGQCVKQGLKPEKIYVDPLVMSIAADTNAGGTFLDTLRSVKERLPEVHTFCGASNVSHGMPQRRILNHTFNAMQVACGMDSFLINVRDRRLMAILLASAALVGLDEWSMEYIKAHREGRLDF